MDKEQIIRNAMQCNEQLDILGLGTAPEYHPTDVHGCTTLCIKYALHTLALQFGALGVGCAGAAVLLYEGVRIAETTLRPIPRIISAPLGGALCGIIALEYPQVCVCVCACACVCPVCCTPSLMNSYLARPYMY